MNESNKVDELLLFYLCFCTYFSFFELCGICWLGLQNSFVLKSSLVLIRPVQYTLNKLKFMLKFALK